MIAFLFFTTCFCPFLFPLVSAINLEGVRAMWESLVIGAVSSFFGFGILILYVLVRSMVQGVPVSPLDQISVLLSLALSMVSVVFVACMLVLFALAELSVNWWNSWQADRKTSLVAQ